MTCKDVFIKHLTDRGMFQAQAEKVFVQYRDKTTNPQNVEMESRWWNDPMQDYPPTMRAIVIMAANREALVWIEKELPDAWYKPMFEAGAA